MNTQKADKSDAWNCSRWAILAGVLVTLGTAALFLTYYQLRFGLNFPPSATGDEPQYDSLGWELAHGRGYQIDTGDTTFRQPYDAAARRNPLYNLGRPVHGPITFRPPAFPVAIAGTNLLLGRQFWAIRLGNALSMAFVLGTLIAIFLCEEKWGAGLAAIPLFVALDTRTRFFGRTILTEPLAALLVAALCVALALLIHERTRWRLVLSALVTGLLILTRTVFIVWLPGLTLLLFWSGRRTRKSKKISTALGESIAWASLVLAILSPWAIRNCLVLGEFSPLGTQGASQLSAAFGDAAWENNGLWTNLEADGFFADQLSPDMSLLEREKITAEISKARAIDWVRTHPIKAAMLVPMKMFQELRPRTVSEGVLLLLAVVGIGAAWRSLIGKVGAALWILNLLAIGLTWSVEGRFLVPMLFVQHYYAAHGTISLLRAIGLSRKGKPVTLPQSPHSLVPAE
ncbi:MAG: glycosyltransferase family 39 protein [Planctomycetaceae bacterium]|nr:glycosyltransferase family 39 protein [Planctomycetaceae bacterium]